MSLRPGSTGWLLLHELRLFWYTALAGSQAGTRRVRWPVVGLGLAVWLLLHFVAFALLRKGGAGVGRLPHELLVAVSAILLATALFMLSTALKYSVETLFERGDMDLLLSSPLSSRSIFAVKLGGMTLGVAALYLFFLAPVAHAGLFLGQFRWLAVYPLLLSMAALASSGAMLLTLGLVRMFGARRTRVIAQVLGALAGALLFLLAQAGNFMSHEGGAGKAGAMRAAAAAAGLDESHPLWLPARAALGDPAAGCLVAALGLAAALLTVRLTHRFFARGLQLAASMGQAMRRTGAVRYRFGRGLMGLVIVKEWRLIARDPQLISQVLLQLLYLLPLCFIVFRQGSLQLPPTGAGLTMLCGSLSAALASIILLAEDAPDLLRTAPVDIATVRMAKLAAAVLPVLGLVALPLVWLTLRAPVAGALTAATVIGAAMSAALINLWTGRPIKRGEFQKRGKRNLVTIVLELCNLLAWAALAMLLLHAAGGMQADRGFLAGAAAASAIALGMAPLAFLLRGRFQGGSRELS